MSIVIKEVTTRRDLKNFIGFPYRLYKGNPFFVPPLRFDEEATLRQDKNPAFEYCESKYWLAYKDERIVGRIAGILNRAYIDKWKNKYLRFGWLDFEEDETVAKALLAEVENWARKRDLVAVHGPLGFTDLDHEGMLVDGFDQLGTLATIYNYPYYPEYLEKFGYQKDVDWVEYRVSIPDKVPENLSRLAAIVKARQKLQVVKTRKPKDILPYADEIFQLVNKAYANLYGVVPLTDAQSRYYTKQYFSFIRADFVSLITDQHGKLAAFGVTMPSLSNALQKANGRLFPFGFIHLLRALKKNAVGDLYLVAVRPDLQGKGVNAIIMDELTRSFIKNGITTAEASPQLEDNTKVQSLWDYYEAHRHKRRRCYIKYLQPSETSLA